MSLFGSPNVEKLKAKRDIPGLLKALNNPKAPTVCRQAAQALGQLQAAEAVDPLITMLKREDPSLREVVVWSLGAIGTPQAVEPVSALLKNSEERLGKASAVALGQIGNPQAIEPLLAVLHREQEPLYPETLAALVQIGSRLDDATRTQHIVAPLGEILINARKDMRLMLLGTLEKMGWRPGQDHLAAAYWIEKGQWDQCVAIGAPAAQPLITALQDEDKNVRQYAFQTLVQIGTPAAPPLIAAFTHPNHEIRQAVFWTLVKMGSDALEPLIEALNDESEEVRLATARALGQIGDARAVVPLIGAFRDLDWSVRRDSYKAIVKIGKPSLPQLLSALSHTSAEIRWGAAGTLEALGWKPGKDETGARYWMTKGEWSHCAAIGPPAVPPLIEGLIHWDPQVAKDALGALVHIGAPAVMPLIESLNHDNPSMRAQAAIALGMIGDKRAEQPLMPLLSEKDKDVSKAASEAISAIQTGEIWRGTS